MKTTLFIVLVLFASVGFCVEIPAFPTSEYAETEVATNFSFAVGESGGCRLVFSLELSATPTNNVEVAIGHDANEDGNLSLDETALAVDYDCGEWSRKPSVSRSDHERQGFLDT